MNRNADPEKLYEAVAENFRINSTAMCRIHAREHGHVNVLTAMLTEPIRHLVGVSEEGTKAYLRAYLDFAEGTASEGDAVRRMVDAANKIHADGCELMARDRAERGAAAQATEELFNRIMKGSSQ